MTHHIPALLATLALVAAVVLGVHLALAGVSAMTPIGGGL